MVRLAIALVVALVLVAIAPKRTAHYVAHAPIRGAVVTDRGDVVLLAPMR